jgi:hypothetical protein
MLKMASGQFQSFAMDTQDAMAKQMYTNFAKQLDQMVKDLANRVNYVEGQEPQYKMENMAQEAVAKEQAAQQGTRKQ